MALTEGWTLEQIVAEVRLITGRPDVGMMSDETIINYINQYYQYVLTKELKIFYGYTYYTFYTQLGVDHYNAPTSFQTINPVVMADGAPINWYIDPGTFYEDYPDNETVKSALVGTTDVSGVYAFTLPSSPVAPGSLYLTDGVNVGQSKYTSGGTFDFFNPLTGTQLTGTTNFLTGQVTNFGFSQITAGRPITATYQTYQAGKPTGILYYNDQNVVNTSLNLTFHNLDWFVVRPIPDQCYKIKMQGIRIPKALAPAVSVGPTTVPSRPFREDLGPLIALATSLTIFRNYNQMDQYDQISGEYERYKNVCMQDTYELYLYQRSVPSF